MERLLNEKSYFFGAILLFTISITALSNDPSPSTQLEKTDENPELLYLDPYINGEKKAGIAAVVTRKDEIWLSQSEWRNLGINMIPSSDKAKEFFNEGFFFVPKEFDPLIDLANLSLHLTIPPEYLPLSLVRNEIIPLIQTPSEMGFYWNYLLLFLHDPLNRKASFYSHHKGVLTSNFGRVTNTFLAGLGQNSRVVRLDDFYAIDFPKNNIFLTIGDSFTDGPIWSSSIPMLGVKVEKSYKYVPEFLSYPTIDFEGALMTEGDIEIHMHNAKYFKKTLPMGRFILENPALPVGSHFGDLIIRDAQGGTRIIPFSYFIDSSMLRPGLSTYSYSLGLVRKNYGVASFDYGGPFFSLRHKWGVTKFWTPELHMQHGIEGLLLGADQRFRLFNLGSAGLTSAINLRDSEIHPLMGVDVLLNKYDINFRSSSLVAFPNFQPLGLSSTAYGGFRYSINSHLRIDKDYIRHTSINHSFIHNNFFRQNTISILQNIPFSSRWQVNINAYYDIFSRNFGAFALLSIFFDRHSVNLAVESDRNRIKTASQYSFNTTSDAGNHYRLTSDIAYDKFIQGYSRIGMENQYFEGDLQLGAGKRSLNYSAQIAGAFGCVASDCFFSKPIENGFALLQVPQRKDVTIAKEFGGIIGKTDSRGNLVITNLRPYEQVKLHALTRDLDPRVSTEELEKSIIIWPGPNTAHRVKFSAPLIRRIMFRLCRDKTALPMGRPVSVVGLLEDGFIGGDGLVYLEIPDTMSAIEGKSEADLCSFTVAMPKRGDDIVENLGDIECQ